MDFGRYSSAQIEGEVIDGKTGEPLSGTVVSIDKLKLAASTDTDGKFNMVVPVGDHELAIRFYGYEESLSKIKVYGKGSLKLELFERSINLDEVIVRAEMAQNNVLRNQMSVVRIDAKAIKELPVSMGEKDIIKSVTLMPGVQSVGEFGTGFNVRGGSADQNLVLMEDVPVFNPSHVFGLISIVNPDEVSGVTLLKAGIPARYGERASSVLDIKLGGNQPEKFTGKGGIGLTSSRLSLKVPLFKKKVVFSLGGRSSYSDWLLQRLPDIDLRNSSARFYDLNSMLIISPNSSNRISLLVT
ncbi:MAG: TonB-dependent receptor plug domain-containing protein [Bacteroidales bacterium]|nr:TonB-dependent receptor plug domain-containing protein [Bacteroidales bacterium]